LDGLEIKGFVRDRLSALKQNWNMDKLVSGTKDEYFKRIEAEREIKQAALDLLKKQQESIQNTYETFVHHMENDFEGFVNYVYDVKKDRDLGRRTDINDMDLFQWENQLRLKE
jgi:hypothetical protein